MWRSHEEVMTLGASKGDVMLIRAEGDDAGEAVGALVELVSADGHWLEGP